MTRSQARLEELKWGEECSTAPATLGSRIPALIGHPRPQEELRRLAVLVLGCGSIGSGAAEDLARSGVEQICLVDPRCLKAESVWTHGIDPAEVGQPKVVAVGQRCKAINPKARVSVFQGCAQDLPLGLLADFDVVFMATDNLAAEVDIGQACFHYGRPLIQASVHPETLVSQTRLWTNQTPDGPCPACTFGALEWDHLQRKTQFSCEGHRSPGMAAPVVGEPTRSFRFLCSLSSNLLINQLLRFVLRLGKPVGDTILEYSGYTNQTVVSHLARNPHCRCDHSRWEIRSASGPLEQQSSAALAEMAGLTGGQVLLTVGEAEFADKGLCKCPEPQVVGRFVDGPNTDLGLCSKCQTPIQSHPAFLHRQYGAALLGPLYHKPLTELGVESLDAVVVQSGSKSVLLRHSEKSL